MVSGCGTWQRLGDVKVEAPYEIVATSETARKNLGLLDQPDPAESLPETELPAPEAPSLPKLPGKVAAEPVLPPVMPQESDVAGDAEKYLIHPGDTLHIQVRGENDLTGDFKVSSEGVIIYSLLGRIAVAGLSASAVESNLTASLGKDYLVSPKLYVQVRSSVMRRVIVFGEVKSPGVYELPVGERFTLLQVIAKAGGLTDLAATDRVRIVRRNGAAEKVLKVSVTDLLNGRGEARDVELKPNDVITIPQTIF
jgi:polysaccharide export outer membrane protein